MAKVTYGTSVRRIRGTSGNAVYRKRGTETVLANRPEASGRPPTEAQLAVRRRFRRAAFYGRHAEENPAKRALYEEAARRNGLSIYSAAMQDYLSPPEIDEFDLTKYEGKAGDAIYIVAIDDHAVDEVNVVMTFGDGTLLEQGSAVKEFEGWWVYTAAENVPAGTTVRIAATARDLPGSRGSGEAEMVVPDDPGQA